MVGATPRFLNTSAWLLAFLVVNISRLLSIAYLLFSFSIMDKGSLLKSRYQLPVARQVIRPGPLSEYLSQATLLAIR